MKITIIGANGQLGTDLMEIFSSYNAIPLTHSQIEITQFESCLILKDIKPDIIINTAAFHKVDACEDNVLKSFLVNAIGAKNVAKICEDIKAINIYISTDYVFDGEKKTPYKESDEPNPINVYGISKYAGELFTKNYCSQYYIIRVASLFGKAGASGKGGNFVETMIKKAKEQELKVINDIIMTPTYTKDCAQMIKIILEKELPYGIYHLTNQPACSWFDFAVEIFKILKMNVSITPITSDEFVFKANRPKNSALISEKLPIYNLKMRLWKNALKDYLKEKGYL